MILEDCLKSGRALIKRMRNLYGVRVGHKMINNWLAARGYLAHRILRKPPLTANHRRLRLDWAQRWQNLIVAAWSQVIWRDESRLQLYPVDRRMRVRRLPGECSQDCQAAKVHAGGGFVHVWGAFHRGAKSTLVRLNRKVNGVVYQDILRGTLVPCARQHFGDNFPYQDDNATSHCSRVMTDRLQQEEDFT